ncbi:MAG: MotA/TolQ/ExbB proton channel family protein [Candidatus Marinimicrobia bacterium]|nr:MotA/TolQ/ExbB proton channel family protein [Candidatus Neomarinimicrobiota bacterium]MCF7850269.1 MotA/TolQ/ExbB proton channel family protein [Candidatus Neomarinimicrobiota bacterium]MCF7903834.1 MotA/TolQ/ExbB proton channel family protein [Candidatus Neomarinimicrobiota bacterium]
MVQWFLNGGQFMWPILIVFIFGLVFVVERFISLMKATIQTKSFLSEINTTLKEQGKDAAIEVCRNTPGSVPMIYLAGLSRADRGVLAAEKAIESAGSIEMSFLENNMIWLSTVVSLAPMLGFTGTVYGMVKAFDSIAAANDIQPALVAVGISMALLTTLFGLIVAMVIQFSQNLFTFMIDRLIIKMEEASIDLLDTIEEMEKS